MGLLKRVTAGRLFFNTPKIKINSPNIYNSNKFYCTSKHQDSSTGQKKLFTTFEEVLQNRRSEASRSVVVQVKDKNSYNKLFNYLQKHGSIKNSFFYSLEPQNTSETRNNRNYILIEFTDNDATESCLGSGQHINKNDVVPVRSPFLWFRLDAKSDLNNSSAPRLRCDPINLTTDLQTLLSSSETFSDGMIALYNGIKLNELGSRLRFITAHQVETAFRSLFPYCSVLPFGSSINGFGKINCDLDLVLTFDDRSPHEVDSSRLIFHSKSLIGLSGRHNQRHLETIADLLQFFLPGCTQVKRILQARVPILKYKQDLTNIDCDLSSTNLSGVYMSELLFLLGIYDERVCPLVFTVRCWAQEIGLTNPAPGRWITNFSLSLLVLFYLQHEQIVPTLETLFKHRRLKDRRSFDNTDCSFLRDLNLLPKNCTKKNDSSLEKLLYGFFQFYSAFDFASYAISLNSGCVIPKPEYSPLYIINPLEKHLNVTKNVSPDECERIKLQFRNAAWIMEFSLNKQDKCENWGFLDLINGHLLHKPRPLRKPGSMKSPKFDMKTLLTDDVEEPTVNLSRDKHKDNADV